MDESGTLIKNAHIFVAYAPGKDEAGEAMMERQIGFQKEGGYLRFSSIVPNTELSIQVSHDGFETAKQSILMGEGERKNVTVTLIKR